MSQFGFGGLPCKLVCPKCSGKSFWVSEVWDGNGIYFHIQNGIMPDEAEDHFQGGAVALEVSCQNPTCKHIWRSRKFKNIHDTVDDGDE